VACSNIAKALPDVHYFPSYEIMMDDLRDYRFYQPDMIHPSSVAEDYIWKKFTASYFTVALLDFLKQYREIRLALNHRPFHPDTNTHYSFMKETLKKLEKVSSVVNVEKEIELIHQQIDYIQQKLQT